MPVHFSINIYDKDENPTEYSRVFVPVKVLRRAIPLAKRLEGMTTNDFTDQDVDDLEAFVVDAFGDKFTKDQMDEGADIMEMMACLNQIMAMANGSANPTLPASL